jgi:hypothetical protein
MPLNGERVRPRRAPRLGYPPERPAFTPAQTMRRQAEYRRLRALIQTPEGVLHFWLEWIRADRDEATAEIFRWFDWFVRTQSPTPEYLERARVLVGALLRG